MAFVILAREVVGVGLEMRSPIEVPAEHLEPMSEVALKEGFDLMYEFDQEPAMEEITRRVTAGESIVNMDSMVRLWVLNQGD